MARLQPIVNADQASVALNSSVVSLPENTDILTYAGIAAGAITVGGAAFIATVVAPSHVIGGTIVAAGLAVGGEAKRRTGHYLPFLHEKDEKKEPVVVTSAEPA